MFLEPIINTIGNYKSNSKGKIKTPTKAERKSKEEFDEELVNIICNLLNNKVDGWIYFKKDEEAFHDEILLCRDVEKILEYVGSHKI